MEEFCGSPFWVKYKNIYLIKLESKTLKFKTFN